jgi:hypothetical protein
LKGGRSLKIRQYYDMMDFSGFAISRVDGAYFARKYKANGANGVYDGL